MYIYIYILCRNVLSITNITNHTDLVPTDSLWIEVALRGAWNSSPPGYWMVCSRVPQPAWISAPWLPRFKNVFLLVSKRVLRCFKIFKGFWRFIDCFRKFFKRFSKDFPDHAKPAHWFLTEHEMRNQSLRSWGHEVPSGLALYTRSRQSMTLAW